MRKVSCTQALLFFVLASLIGVVLWSAQTKAQTKSHFKKDKYQLLETRKVTEASVCWLWRIGEKNQLYPFLQQQAHQIIFTNPEGKPIATYAYLPNAEITGSPTRKYLSTVTLEASATPFAELKTICFHVYNHLGEKQYQIKQSIGYDDPLPKCYLLDCGEAILANAALGKLELFSSMGQSKKHILLFSKNVFSYEKPMSLALSKYDQFMAIVTQLEPATLDPLSGQSRSGQPFLFYYSKDGQELWRKPLSEQTAGRVDISPDGMFCVVSHFSSLGQHSESRLTEIYDFSGERIMRLNTLFQQAAFSDDNRYLALANHDQWQLIDLIQKQPLWHSQTQQNRLIIDVRFHPSSKILGLLTGDNEWIGNKFVFTHPKLQLHDIQGKLLWEYEFSPEQIEVPSFAFADSEMRFGIGFRYSYRIYEDKSDFGSKR